METTATSPLLKLQGLSASVGDKPILHDIDLAIGAHETHVMMGPNGAGKSTLGHVIMGDPEYSVTSGTVTFDGQDITDLSPDKRSRAGLFLSFQAPVEIPGVPLSSFLRATVAGREGFGQQGLGAGLGQDGERKAGAEVEVGEVNHSQGLAVPVDVQAGGGPGLGQNAGGDAGGFQQVQRARIDAERLGGGGRRLSGVD